MREESPGSKETRWRLTAAGGDPRDSATENKPPVRAWVRVKRCGKSAPRGWQHPRQGKPHREQDQIGVAACGATWHGARFHAVTRVGCYRRLATAVADEWPSRRGNPPNRTRLTDRLDFICGSRGVRQWGNRVSAAQMKDGSPRVPYCPTALLPYCPTALLPYCLTALLPYCPTALFPYSLFLPAHASSASGAHIEIGWAIFSTFTKRTPIQFSV
jgi:hypothetical protein